MPVEKIAITYIEPGKLKPNERNARKHSPEQVAAIRASIDRFGFTNPILVKEDGETVGAGHGRLEAALLDPPLERVPRVILKGLSDSEWRALVLADNKLALNSTWDEDILKAELLALGDEMDLGDLGFSDVDLSALFLEREEGENDPNAEWQGMPEFRSEDKTAFRTIPVHFNSQADVDAFAALIGQPVGEKARYLWFPNIEIGSYADKRYASE